MMHKFSHRFPDLVALARESENAEKFKALLLEHITKSTSERHRERMQRLIEYDDKVVDELSTGEKIHLKTITRLWELLNGTLSADVSDDMFLDLYHQFELLEEPKPAVPDYSRFKKMTNRWATGLDFDVIQNRDENKRRIIQHLVRKIERRSAAPHSRYQFEAGMSDEEKYAQVQKWWNSSRFQLAMAVKSPTELNIYLGNSLSAPVMRTLMKAKKKGIPFFVTPYYLSLLNTNDEGYNDATIRSYILYSEELVDTYGDIKAWEKEDEIDPGKPNAAGWLLPDGKNIHRRYPEVAILIPDSMGRSCGGLCASCQRMYDFQSKRLNFNFEDLKPKETWDKKLRRLMQYFEEDTQLRDILITGGDALMSQNATLRRILDAVYKMAVRKREANKNRPNGEKYAEMQRVRLGSRLLAYLPFRIDDELVNILRDFKEKAEEVGIGQFYVQTHFQSPLEVTPEAKRAIRAIQSAGWTITNQLVFTLPASRRGHTAKLRQVLSSLGIVCYYTFTVKGFHENYALYTPNARSIQEAKEEKIYLPSNVGTDRNVLNLPAIGKSMTFALAGITEEGKRVLRFQHDHTRRHSPIIDRLEEVYIVEGKSIGAYLRQLKELGEDSRAYRSIWNYCEAKTESRNLIYHYPDFPFDITERLSNYPQGE